MSKKKQITSKLSIDKDKDINDFKGIIESDIDDLYEDLELELELDTVIDSDLESELGLESESESESELESDISITKSKDKLGLKKTVFSNKIEIIHHYDYDNIDIEDFDKYNDLVELIYESDSKKLSQLKEDKKRLFCDYCNNDDIVEDTSHGIIVCKSCGQVLSTLMDSNPEWTQYNDDNKKDMNRCSHPISQLLPQSSTATTIAGSCSSRIKTLHGMGCNAI